MRPDLNFIELLGNKSIRNDSFVPFGMIALFRIGPVRMICHGFDGCFVLICHGFVRIVLCCLGQASTYRTGLFQPCRTMPFNS